MVVWSISSGDCPERPRGATPESFEQTFGATDRQIGCGCSKVPKNLFWLDKSTLQTFVRPKRDDLKCPEIPGGSPVERVVVVVVVVVRVRNARTGETNVF